MFALIFLTLTIYQKVSESRTLTTDVLNQEKLNSKLTIKSVNIENDEVFKKSSEKIRSMMKDGVTVILVSHSLTQVRQICDRCIWLENGRVYMEGETRKVCDAYLKRAKK